VADPVDVGAAVEEPLCRLALPALTRAPECVGDVVLTGRRVLASSGSRRSTSPSPAACRRLACAASFRRLLTPAREARLHHIPKQASRERRRPVSERDQDGVVEITARLRPPARQHPGNPDTPHDLRRAEPTARPETRPLTHHIQPNSTTAGGHSSRRLTIDYRHARDKAKAGASAALPTRLQRTTNNCAAATSSDACFALPKEASGRHRLVLSRLVRICAARSCQAFDLVVVGLRRVGRGAGRVRVGGHGWCGARGRPAVSRSTTVPCGRPAT
jgi:hypothetical protein